MQDGGLVVDFGAAERRRSHPGVNGGQMVMEGIEVFQKGGRCGAQHLQDAVVAGLEAKLVEKAAEELQHCSDIDTCRATGKLTAPCRYLYFA